MLGTENTLLQYYKVIALLKHEDTTTIVMGGLLGVTALQSEINLLRLNGTNIHDAPQVV